MLVRAVFRFSLASVFLRSLLSNLHFTEQTEVPADFHFGISDEHTSHNRGSGMGLLKLRFAISDAGGSRWKRDRGSPPLADF